MAERKMAPKSVSKEGFIRYGKQDVPLASKHEIVCVFIEGQVSFYSSRGPSGTATFPRGSRLWYNDNGCVARRIDP